MDKFVVTKQYKTDIFITIVLEGYFEDQPEVPLIAKVWNESYEYNPEPYFLEYLSGKVNVPKIVGLYKGPEQILQILPKPFSQFFVECLFDDEKPSDAIFTPSHLLIMERIPGVTLADLVYSTDTTISGKEIKELLLKFWEQLMLLHVNNVIHGDILERNVMITPSPDNKIYLIDFQDSIHTKGSFMTKEHLEAYGDFDMTHDWIQFAECADRLLGCGYDGVYAVHAANPRQLKIMLENF